MENRLLAAEMTSYDDPVAGIDLLDGLGQSVTGNHLVQLRSRIMAHLALKVGDSGRFTEAVSKLRSSKQKRSDRRSAAGSMGPESWLRP